MWRKLLVYMFVVSSLLTQASTVYACSMMNTVSVKCCCHDEGISAPAASTESPATCCEEILVVDQQSGWVDSSKLTGHNLLPDIQPQLLATFLVFALGIQQVPPRRSWPDLPAFGPGAGTATYLQTLRLRI